jgi:hypothetical protein
MSDDRPPDVLGSLPKTRPHRRSAKRPRLAETPAAQPAADQSEAAAKAPSAKPRAGRPAKPASRRKPAPKPKSAAPATRPPARRIAPPPASDPPLIGTAVKAAAELAEIGLSASARAVREMLSRLPRP